MTHHTTQRERCGYMKHVCNIVQIIFLQSLRLCSQDFCPDSYGTVLKMSLLKRAYRTCAAVNSIIFAMSTSISATTRFCSCFQPTIFYAGNQTHNCNQLSPEQRYLLKGPRFSAQRWSALLHIQCTHSLMTNRYDKPGNFEFQEIRE